MDVSLQPYFDRGIILLGLHIEYMEPRVSSKDNKRTRTVWDCFSCDFSYNCRPDKDNIPCVADYVPKLKMYKGNKGI